MQPRMDKITSLELELLRKIGNGYTSGAILAAQVSRSPQGVAQTATSLIRKQLVSKSRWKGIVHYRLTADGRARLKARGITTTADRFTAWHGRQFCHCVIPVHREGDSTCLTCNRTIR